jgi:4-hydroxybenzoate polyprenyltransferase
VAGALVGAGAFYYAGLLAVALMLGWQVWSLDPRSTSGALVRFRSNHWVGLALTVGMIADWLW